MVFLLMMLLGCPQETAECSEDVPCPFGSVCVAGECESHSCATSFQCGLNQHCENSSCVDGCETHDDCGFGDLCDAETQECVAAECTDTKLDCGFGEFCNPGGECYQAGGYYCAPCEDDGDCGGNGNMCLNGGYCGVTCDSDTDCPGGFDCLPVSDFNGNVVSNQCFTYCWLYEEE
ncbi:MAG: hypothetical protein Q8P41_16705 [Pseudomonadota bacterium]|nr:hypothetical protein [Pseudomonadota bacterium]